MHFSQGSIPESLVKKNRIDKIIQLLLKVATQIEYKKDMVSTNSLVLNHKQLKNADLYSENAN